MMIEPHLELSDIPVSEVNPDSPVPLYHQIEQDLRRLIREGIIPTDAILPPELILSHAYNVGRHTMRMALSRLAADGLISRRAGRGTVVKRPGDRTKFLLDRSFTQQMADMGRVARTRVLEMRTGIIDASSHQVFVDQMGMPCLVLNRLRFGDDEPIGIQFSTILTEYCPNLEQHDFDQFGLYDILAREYKLTIREIHHTITAAVANVEQARLLEIAEGDPLVVVNTITYFENDKLFEHTTSFYRADKYEYSTRHMYSPT